ncbi:MAG: Ig-like domain-containing protein [Nitrospira sp.]|nr:Ig-like domain-containing protein [Nitrospira sp.]
MVSPTVTITPVNGATNSPFNTSIILTFSEPINPNTVNTATGISTRTTTTATFSELENPNTITPTTFQFTSGWTPIAWAYSFST